MGFIVLQPSNLAVIGSITFTSRIVAGDSLTFLFAALFGDSQEDDFVVYVGEVALILGFQSSILHLNSNWIGNLVIVIVRYIQDNQKISKSQRKNPDYIVIC